MAGINAMIGYLRYWSLLNMLFQRSAFDGGKLIAKFQTQRTEKTFEIKIPK